MRNWIIVIVFACILTVLSLYLPPQLMLAAAYFSFIIGNAELKKGGGGMPAFNPASQPGQLNRPAAAASSALASTEVQLPERPVMDEIPKEMKCPSCGANIKPTSKLCTYCGTSLTPLVDLPEPVKLNNLEIGKSVRVKHPTKGDVTYQILGRLLYTELWQASRGPNVPWTPTENYYAGYALEPSSFLLNWQDRFYLLEEKRSLTDMDINRDFVPAARQFAQSNQTAKVDFSYGGGRYQMVDIGRFAIEFEDGEGLHLHKGAIGRFIHASGDNNQALIVDDFQSGGSGGQDTLWKGFQIQESDIVF